MSSVTSLVLSAPRKLLPRCPVLCSCPRTGASKRVHVLVTAGLQTLPVLPWCDAWTLRRSVSGCKPCVTVSSVALMTLPCGVNSALPPVSFPNVLWTQRGSARQAAQVCPGPRGGAGPSRAHCVPSSRTGALT